MERETAIIDLSRNPDFIHRCVEPPRFEGAARRAHRRSSRGRRGHGAAASLAQRRANDAEIPLVLLRSASVECNQPQINKI